MKNAGTTVGNDENAIIKDLDSKDKKIPEKIAKQLE